MKIGDLVIMPGEHVPEGHAQSVGIVVDDTFPMGTTSQRKKRVGIMWGESLCVDWEPIEWLKVLNESR